MVTVNRLQMLAGPAIGGVSAGTPFNFTWGDFCAEAVYDIRSANSKAEGQAFAYPG